MAVSAIIVTIGAKAYLKSCLDSLFAQSYIPFEIIVIDNSLKHDFIHEINRLYPSVRTFAGSENLFYAAGINKGIELSEGEFVLCLNDDIVLDKNFIQEALKGFKVRKNIGMVSGKFLRRDRETLDSTGLFLSIWRTAKERGYGKPDLRQFEKNGLIFGVNGAAAFYRRQMLDEIKSRGDYFDSRFKMFYEDLDLCWRANKSGWQSYYISSAVVYHVRGGSFRPDFGIDKAIARKYLNDQLLYGLIKNRYLTILKNETLFGFLLHSIPILIYDLCAWFYVIFFRPKVIKLFFHRKEGKSLNNYHVN
jgi:GT2 family glycosyltransferase